MTTFLTVIHVFACVFLVAVVLLQSGRAGGMGVLSGAATQTVFGGRGAGGFLTRATSVCAAIFILTSASLAYMSSSTRDSLSRGHRATPTTPARPPTKNTPAAPASGAGTPTPAPAPAPAAPAPTPAAPAAPAPEAPAAPAPAPAPTH